MINISKAALAEIRRLHSKHQSPETKLRLGVQRGGCAELYYTIDFDETTNFGDRVFECDDILVTVDADSIQHLANLTLDYSEDLMGGGFRFHNPNALESCGCGNSFRIST